jgi:hypothetical protein
VEAVPVPVDTGALETAVAGEDEASTAVDEAETVAKTPAESAWLLVGFESEEAEETDVTIVVGWLDDAAADVAIVVVWLDDAADEALEASPEAVAVELLLEDEELDELDPVSPPMPFTALQVPVNDPESSATVYLFVTSGPGLGNWTSLPSTVVQPFPRLATKISGRLEYAVDGALAELDAEFTVTEAQLI